MRPKVFSLFWLILSSSFCSILKQDSNSDLSKAISDIVRVLYFKEHISFDTIVYGKVTWKTLDILDEFMKLSQNETLGHSVFYFDPQSWHHYIDCSALFIINDLTSAVKMIQKVNLVNNLPANLKFLIYIQDLKLEDLQKIPKKLLDMQFYGYFMLYTYFVITEQKEIMLVSSEWFTEQLCNEQQFVVLNRFDRKTKKWQNQRKIYQKFQNFHNCLIVNDLRIDISGDNYRNKVDGKLSGLIVDLAKVISQQGNFTVYQQATFLTSNGVEPILENGSVFIHPIIVFALRGIVMMQPYGDCFVTSTFVDSCYTFVMPIGDKYSSYEKMMMPFDELTWIYLLVTFGVALFAISISTFLPKIVRKTITGDRVQHPGFNLIGTFFGIGQCREPTENSARILLMFFILFCLVMRTAYQGKFSFLN
jgi:hypothetical protein